MRKAVVVVLSSIFLLAFSGFGFALASIPDSSGEINGCYAAVTGSLRVIDSGKKCLPTETPISWNQTGPQGLPGQTGQPGAGIFKADSAGTGSAGGTSYPGGNSVVASCPSGDSAVGASWALADSSGNPLTNKALASLNGFSVISSYDAGEFVDNSDGGYYPLDTTGQSSDWVVQYSYGGGNPVFEILVTPYCFPGVIPLHN